MSKVIAFSGGCFSGKTSAIQLVKDDFIAKGLTCVVIEELIRDYKIKSIDDLRSDPNAYFDIQEQIITKKIMQEEKSIIMHYDVVLIDRAISDSLFYLLFYVDANKLTPDRQDKYLALVNFVTQYAKLQAFKEIYSCVAFFKPINAACEDTVFRPHDINMRKFTESAFINFINLANMAPELPYISFDLNYENIKNVPNVLIEYL